jgi:AbrB family looped-hinge helix DNA binding protein
MWFSVFFIERFISKNFLTLLSKKQKAPGPKRYGLNAFVFRMQEIHQNSPAQKICEDFQVLENGVWASYKNIFDMLKTVKVSDKGQIAIPLEIREQMNIERGEELVLIQLDGKLLIEKSQKVSKKMEDDFRDILKFSEKSLKEVWDNKQDDIWSKYLKR